MRAVAPMAGISRTLGGPALALVALCISLVLIHAASSSDALPRGADPAAAAAYVAARSSGTFACLDGSRQVPLHAINDDFCDCVNGSDEPGTSACPRGTFYCKNLGHTPKVLPSSFVNDSVCDCCDGSDEAKGVCENECLSSAKVHMQELEKKLSHYSEGLQMREEYVLKAAEAKQSWGKRLGELDIEIEEHQKLVEGLRVQKEAIEAEEEKQREEEDEARRVAEEARRAEESDAAEDAGSTESTVEEGDVEEEEEATKLANEVMGEEEDEEEDPEEVGRRIAARWTSDPDAAGGKASGDDGSGDYAGDAGEAGENGEYSDSYTDYAPDYSLDYAPERDYAGDYGEADWEGGESYDHDYEGSDAEGQYYGEYDGEADEGEHEESENDKIKHEFSEADSKLRELQKERTKLTARLGMDFGQDGVWAQLVDSCVSAKVDKYTYEICINGEAKQKEGHSSVSLGTSSGLDPGSKQLKFAGGQACWQGPKRSMTVRLECGMAEELMQVEEPSRCEYAAVLLTPAACSHEDMHTAEAELRELTLIMTQVHDEL
mmetsp:Transcript_39000/g.69880  ORF Transcript_39000/g.69880 Transcript_39000/m.69880 type:complete len:548 (-) Transcript_39000:39-1682(-)